MILITVSNDNKHTKYRLFDYLQVICDLEIWIKKKAMYEATHSSKTVISITQNVTSFCFCHYNNVTEIELNVTIIQKKYRTSKRYSDLSDCTVRKIIINLFSYLLKRKHYTQDGILIKITNENKNP